MNDYESKMLFNAYSYTRNMTADAAKSGAAAPATDVDTTGSSKEKDPEPEDPTPPEGWTQSPYVQVEGGFIAGVSLGLVPFGGVGQQVLDAAEVLPHGTPEARGGGSPWGRSSAG